MHKAIVHIYADAQLEPEKLSNTPTYRGGEERKRPQRAGLVFETTVTGESLEEVTHKATSMLEMNLQSEKGTVAVEAIQRPIRNRGL